MSENKQVTVIPANTPMVPVTPQSEQFEMEQRMARLFVSSGLFSDIKGQTQEQAIAQAWVKIAIGKSMGFSEAESMAGIDIIQGRPAVSAQLRAARMQRSGFHWHIVKHDNESCVLKIFHGDEELGDVGFAKEDAQMAGLLGKDNYKKDPSSMYFARAITRAQRRFAPGVLSGDILSREEAMDDAPTMKAAKVNGADLKGRVADMAKEGAGETA